MEERKASLRRALVKVFPQPEKTGDVVCEIGCGHGHFLVAYAHAHPAARCIGIDIERTRIERAIRKQERARATQLHFLQADAGLFLDALPAGVMLGRVFILFPDPWPKTRHHKNRLIQSKFLDELRRRASSATRIFFRTDHELYFEDARTVFERHAGWQLVDEHWPFEHETVFQSRATSYRSLVARLRTVPP